MLCELPVQMKRCVGCGKLDVENSRQCQEANSTGRNIKRSVFHRFECPAERRCWFFFTTMICWLIWSKKEGVAFKTVGAGEGLDEHDTVSALPWYTFLYLLLQSYYRWSYPPELFAALSYSYSWSFIVWYLVSIVKTRKILSREVKISPGCHRHRVLLVTSLHTSNTLLSENQPSYFVCLISIDWTKWAPTVNTWNVE